MVWEANPKCMKKPNHYEAGTRLPVTGKIKKKERGCGGQKGGGVTKHWQELRGHFFLLCELKKKKRRKRSLTGEDGSPVLELV